MRDRDSREESKQNELRSGLLVVALRNPLASLLAGLRFLTIIPITWKSENDTQFFQASVLWFPLIGAIIGFIAVIFVALSACVLPGNVVAVFAMAMFACITGCLHLDGVADSGDGLLSGRPRETALEIMRDSRTGAMGVIAIVFLLLGKYATLSTCTPLTLLYSVFLMPIAGRTAIVLTMAFLPYARTGQGLGQLFYTIESRTVATIGLFFCITISLLFSVKIALAIFVAIVVTVGLFSLWCHKKLGGATGDTLGAVCELTELAVAVSIAAVTSQAGL